MAEAKTNTTFQERSVILFPLYGFYSSHFSSVPWIVTNFVQPIPMPLLFLESMNDEPIIKQRAITAPLGRTAPAGPSGSQLSKVNSNGVGLEHSATSSSLNTLTPIQSNDPDSKILYPFRVKHLGHEVYTLYAISARDRLEWC